MPKVEYTDSDNKKHILDLYNPTAKDITDFYEKYIKQHDPAAQGL